MSKEQKKKKNLIIDNYTVYIYIYIYIYTYIHIQYIYIYTVYIHTYIRGVTIHVFVMNRHGTGISVRCMRPYDEYRRFTLNPEGGARSNAMLFDNHQQKNRECCESCTLENKAH